MKAAVVNAEDGRFAIEDIDIDEPRGREVLVEVKASGLCHTDIHMAEGGFGIPLPAVFGHELAGVVRAVGPSVIEFQLGDHVVASPIRYCGHCAACLDGRSYQCEHPLETQRSSDEPPRLSRAGERVNPVFGTAAFAQMCLVHENQLAKIPPEMPFPQACVLGCATATGAGSVINVAAVKAGDTVAVIGIGGVGVNILAGAKLVGASRIIAVDNNPAREELAARFGATEFVCSATSDPVGEIQRIVPGGVHHAFEAVGLKVTAEQAMDMIRVGGSVYVIGAARPGTEMNIDITGQLLRKQARVQGVVMGAVNIKRDLPAYAQLYLEGRLNLDDMISGEINLSEINEAYDRLKAGQAVRTVITSF